MGLGPIGQRRAQCRGGGGRRGRPLTPGWAPGRATPTPATLVDRRALSAPCLSRQAVASFFQGDPAGMWQNCGWNTLPAPLCPLPPRSGSHCHRKACATCMCVLKVSRVARADSHADGALCQEVDVPRAGQLVRARLWACQAVTMESPAASSVAPPVPSSPLCAALQVFPGGPRLPVGVHCRWLGLRPSAPRPPPRAVIKSLESAQPPNHYC